MRNSRCLPQKGDRPIVLHGLDGGRSWRWCDWAVTEVDYYPSPSEGKPAIAICHCEYSPLEGKPKWHQVIGPFPCDDPCGEEE